MKSSDEIIESIISGVGGDIFLKDESLDIDFRNCQPISTCTILEYDNNDYLSVDVDTDQLVIGESPSEQYVDKVHEGKIDYTEIPRQIGAKYSGSLLACDEFGKRLFVDSASLLGGETRKNKRKSTIPKRLETDDEVFSGGDSWHKEDEITATNESTLVEENNSDSISATASKPKKSSIKSQYEYLCHNCNVSFSSRGDFETHYINAYQKTPLYTCTKCKKQLQNIRSFRGHIYRHVITSYKHQCSTCSRKFISSELLEQHQRIHLVVQQKCIDCGKEFPNYDELKQHKREHRTAEKLKNKDLKWKCIDCGKMLMNRSSLFMHEKIHKDRQYSCTYCPQKFVQKINLTNHVKTHTQDKKFSCPECSKTFVGKSQLMRHHTFHVKHRTFKCETCGKLYKSERDLKVHTLIHSVQRPHACNHCGKTFLSSSKLKQHFNIHTGARPYKCKYCQKDFTNFPNWLKHIRRRHKVDHKTGEQLEEMPNFLIKDRKENKIGKVSVNDGRTDNLKKKTERKQSNKKPKIDQTVEPVEVLTMSMDDTLPLNTSDDMERAASFLIHQTLEMEENDPRFNCLSADVSDISDQNLFHTTDFMADQIIFSTAITEPNISSSFGQLFSYPVIPTEFNDDQRKITLPPITTMKNKRNLIHHNTQHLFSANVL